MTEEKPTNARPAWLYYVIAVLIAIVPILLVGVYAYMNLGELLKPIVLKYGMAFMSEEDKADIYALLAEQSPGAYEAVPEHRVGYTLKKNIRFLQTEANVASNNAGMRAHIRYIRKLPDRFRIVCLGDSFTYGMGGNEQDRFGNQIEDTLRVLGVKVDGKPIEVYTLALPGWNSVNEATYLSNRITEYDPDIVLVLMVANDFSDTYGVSGIGQLTASFSPSSRTNDSGVIKSSLGKNAIRIGVHNILQYDLCPESRRRWIEAFDGWKRLEHLLDLCDKKMVVGIAGNRLFVSLGKYYYHKSGLKSPFIVTSILEERLEHDNHPNKKGHHHLALHYLHTMARLGWIPVSPNDLATLDERLDTTISPPTNEADIRSLKKGKANVFLCESLSFNNLDKMSVRGILGGISFRPGDQSSEAYPDGFPRTVFLLRRKESAKKVFVEIDVPPRRELYPFELNMRLNDIPAAKLILDDWRQAGRKILGGEIPESDEYEFATEVSLKTESYWTGIVDPTTRSYTIISAWQE